MKQIGPMEIKTYICVYLSSFQQQLVCKPGIMIIRIFEMLHPYNKTNLASLTPVIKVIIS